MNILPIRWNALWLAAIALIVSLVACSTESAVPDSDTENESTEASLAQSAMDDVGIFVENEALQAGTGKADNSLLGPCKNVVRSMTATDSTITITFPGGAACLDGKVRSGTIYVSWSKDTLWREPGKVVKVRSSNYTVNGVMHKFKTLHKLTDTLPQPKWTRNTVDTITVAGQTGTGYWNAAQVRILTTGWRVSLGSRIWEVYGTTTGTSGRGIGYTCTVNNLALERLRFQPGTCYYPTQGTVTIVRADKTVPRVVTFGPGCKTTYSVTVGNLTLTLPF